MTRAVLIACALAGAVAGWGLRASPADHDDPVLLAVLDRAIADGEWSEADRTLAHQTLARLSPAGRRRALRTVAVAMNQQRLRVGYDGPPF